MLQIPPNSVTASSMSLSMVVETNSTALAYLWETTPVLGTGALPIYADDEYKFPAAPWWYIIDITPTSTSRSSPKSFQNDPSYLQFIILILTCTHINYFNMHVC